jgi:hypothetical protein
MNHGLFRRRWFCPGEIEKVARRTGRFPQLDSFTLIIIHRHRRPHEDLNCEVVPISATFGCRRTAHSGIDCAPRIRAFLRLQDRWLSRSDHFAERSTNRRRESSVGPCGGCRWARLQPCRRHRLPAHCPTSSKFRLGDGRVYERHTEVVSTGHGRVSRDQEREALLR